MTTEEIRHALTDPIALICTLYGEARQEPIEGLIAVGCVVRNRVQIDLDERPDTPNWWGATYREVCLKKWQFSCFWEDNSNTRAVYALAEGLLADMPTGDRGLLTEMKWIADGIIQNQIRDVTRGADHYLTTTLFRRDPPDWATQTKPVCVIGSHAFFRLN